VIRMKALSTVIILSTAFATPAFARGGIGSDYDLSLQPITNYRSNFRSYDQNFRGSYDQSGASYHAAPLTSEEHRNLEDFGFSGRDPSRVGGEDPYLHPGG
jgi:hypothetical protein